MDFGVRRVTQQSHFEFMKFVDETFKGRKVLKILRNPSNPKTTKII